MSGPQRTIEDLVGEFVLCLEADPSCDLDALLAEHAEHADEIRRRIELLRAAGLLPGVASGAAAPDPLATIRMRLERRGDFSLRYSLAAEVGRGGMGRILEAREGDLQRRVAMKVFHPRDDASNPALISRFLHEARITAQLDHPGIVPVHELGLDDQGQLYFTMRLVAGEDLRQIYEHVAIGHDGWSQPRALGVLLKVCEALGYAHEKGVIHRDLKPANVMVGKHGEVYVMDWGLARMLGHDDPFDLRIAPEPAADRVETPGAELARTPSHPTDAHAVPVDVSPGDTCREYASDSPLVTRNGDIVGTPAYMPPEQARGDLAALGPRSDVYAVGAMLYHLVAGRMPFVPAAPPPSPRAILRRVLAGPPAPLLELAPDTPPELVAICEKAMARDPGQRYANTTEFGEDLRAFLELRIVRAYRTGAWVEAEKWVQRNQPLALALLGVVLAVTAGAVAFKIKADEAAQRAKDVMSLSAIQDSKELRIRADALWPASPDMLPLLEEWLEDARTLIDGRSADPSRGLAERRGLEHYRAQLAELRRSAIAQPNAKGISDDSYDFASITDRWWHSQLSTLVADLESLCDERSGGPYSSGVSEAHGWGVPRRIEFARSIRERSIDSPEARALWEEAVTSIASAPRYGGIRITPILGLLPLGPDPSSELWEFAHLQTGEAPRRGSDRQLECNGATGLVFVLLPGGRFSMGAQSDDPTGGNFDQKAREDESPVHEVELSPFLISKYEMTQGQWERVCGDNPSVYVPWHYSTAWNVAGKGWSARHPVECVSATECTRLLRWLGLGLPSEAQWEYACRAGTTEAYSCGSEPESLRGHANISDAFAKDHAEEPWKDRTWEPFLDDGNAIHAEVGSYLANGFGLHDMHGNVWEFCSDGYAIHAYEFARGKDPVLLPTPTDGLVNRGGSFCDSAHEARSAIRNHVSSDFRAYFLGLRPVLTLPPP